MKFCYQFSKIYMVKYIFFISIILSDSLIISIMKFWYQFSKIYMRKNWLEIWYSCAKLVTFATVKIRSNKRKKNTIKNVKTIVLKKGCKKILYIYIYILREREREKEKRVQVSEVTSDLILQKVTHFIHHRSLSNLVV